MKKIDIYTNLYLHLIWATIIFFFYPEFRMKKVRSSLFIPSVLPSSMAGTQFSWTGVGLLIPRCLHCWTNQSDKPSDDTSSISPLSVRNLKLGELPWVVVVNKRFKNSEILVLNPGRHVFSHRRRDVKQQPTVSLLPPAGYMMYLRLC